MEKVDRSSDQQPERTEPLSQRQPRPRVQQGLAHATRAHANGALQYGGNPPAAEDTL